MAEPADEQAAANADAPGETPEATLRRCGALGDRPFDIANAALALACVDDPTAEVKVYRDHLAELARDAEAVAREREPTIDGMVAALNGLLLTRHGYDGDAQTYNDLRNANLMRVIDRRRGLPVALGILYMHAARAAGWTIQGLNFPAHFLVRLDNGPERAVIDPFNRGRVRDAAGMRVLLKQMAGAKVELTPDHYRPVSDRQVLLRLHNNVKARLLRLQRVAEAARAVDAMLWLAPEEATLWRESGMMHGHLNNLRHAMTALEKALALGLNDAQRREAEDALSRLRARLN
jgi:regulator of sirC expression with transglutaminase-like and TPR domain